MKFVMSMTACALSALTLSFGAFAQDDATPEAGGAYNIINQNSGLCLKVANNSYAENASIIQSADCNSTAAQWNYVDRGNGWYSVRNNYSGLCLAVHNGSGQLGTPAVQISNCDSTAAQWVAQWYQAYVRLYVRHSGLCLGIEGGSAYGGSKAVQTDACTSRAAQWYFVNLHSRP